MFRKYVICMLSILCFTAGTAQADLHAQSFRCNSETGTVLSVVNDEFFMIGVCDEVKKFEEFTYCYGVMDGDTVMFEWDHRNCEVASFTVLRTGVQCGVWCQ